MKFLIFFTIVSCSWVLMEGWIDVDESLYETFYEKDLISIFNEVRHKTDEALKTAKVVANERFVGNQSHDVVLDMAEILNKAQSTSAKIEKWIKENNRTGELIKDAEECVLNILEETTDETLDYLAKLEKLCWNKHDWEVPIRSILVNITDLADDGKNLYYEFLEDLSECIEDERYDQECVAFANEWIRSKAEDLLHASTTYTDLLTFIDEEYEANGRKCQETIKGRISWISANVIDGLRECKRKKT